MKKKRRKSEGQPFIDLRPFLDIVKQFSHVCPPLLSATSGLAEIIKTIDRIKGLKQDVKELRRLVEAAYSILKDQALSKAQSPEIIPITDRYSTSLKQVIAELSQVAAASFIERALHLRKREQTLKSLLQEFQAANDQFQRELLVISVVKIVTVQENVVQVQQQCAEIQQTTSDTQQITVQFSSEVHEVREHVVQVQQQYVELQQTTSETQRITTQISSEIHEIREAVLQNQSPNISLEPAILFESTPSLTNDEQNLQAQPIDSLPHASRTCDAGRACADFPPGLPALDDFLPPELGYSSDYWTTEGYCFPLSPIMSSTTVMETSPFVQLPLLRSTAEMGEDSRSTFLSCSTSSYPPPSRSRPRTLSPPAPATYWDYTHPALITPQQYPVHYIPDFSYDFGSYDLEPDNHFDSGDRRGASSHSVRSVKANQHTGGDRRPCIWPEGPLGGIKANSSNDESWRSHPIRTIEVNQHAGGDRIPCIWPEGPLGAQADQHYRVFDEYPFSFYSSLVSSIGEAFSRLFSSRRKEGFVACLEQDSENAVLFSKLSLSVAETRWRPRPIIWPKKWLFWLFYFTPHLSTAVIPLDSSMLEY
ncbi:hypothetical protein DL96DRAFT_1810558 [Flagelloscypha sp. PMI_526]|nr:hypothetical protein DL96DRAFT_1810558 [Flagelloscypha sp. PMI_526]